MSNIHPFYRFSPAWNTGFYPQNQITSNQLNDIYVALQAWLPSFTLGDSFASLKAQVRAVVQPFNEFPVLGNFEIITTTAPDPPFMDYYVYVRDQDLYKTDNSQQLLITGQYNATTKAVVSASITGFTVGTYSGTFDAAPVQPEDEVKRVLEIVNDYGSAIFPLVYSYNSTSGLATSGLARASSYQLTDGVISASPADTLPQLNARRFTLPALSAEDKFAITFMERIINASFNQTDTVAIQGAYNSLAMPDAWTKTYLFNGTGYDRIQITLDSGGDRVFALVGRYDAEWNWQRFVNDIGVSATNQFISNYSASTQLPYEPLSGSSYVYLDTWYDFEFCDFTPECYVSPEFYAMPAIPGDVLQFNVPSDQANLTGIDNVLVGLFEEDGGFLQLIGSGERLSKVCTQFECEHTFEIEVSLSELEAYIEKINDSIPVSPFSQPSEFKWVVKELLEVTEETILFFPLTYGLLPFSIGTLTGLLAQYDIILEQVDEETYKFSYSSNLLCGNYQYLLSTSVDASDQFSSKEFICNCPINKFTQLFCSCTIPAVADGCYRLGLYNDVEGQLYLYSLSNIINIDRADCFSTILEFWSDDDTIAEGLEYYDGWKQRIRVGLNGGGEKPVIEENLYRQSNGVHKRPQNKQDLSLDLHTDFFDLDTQLAMTDATRHPYLVWSGKPIFVKGDIEVATTQDFTTQSSFETLSQMKFQALIQGFQPRNSSCLTC
jgi:hypothetical protein